MLLFDQLIDTARIAIILDMSHTLLKTLYRKNKEQLKASVASFPCDIKLTMLLQALRNNQMFLAEIWITLGANPTEAIPYIIDDARDDTRAEAESHQVDAADSHAAMAACQCISPGHISLQSKLLIFLSQHGGNIDTALYLRKLAEASVELQQCMFYMNMDINTTWSCNHEDGVTFLMHLMLSGKHGRVVRILRMMIARQRFGWSLKRDNLEVLLEINPSMKPFPHIIKDICGYFPPPQHHVLDIEKKTVCSARGQLFVKEKNIIMCARDQQCPYIVAMLNVYYAGMFL